VVLYFVSCLTFLLTLLSISLAFPLAVEKANGHDKPVEAAKDGKDGKKKAPPPKVPYWKLYQYTSAGEKVMLVLGILGGLGHGLIQPLFIRTFGQLIDTLSNPASSTVTYDPSNPMAYFDNLLTTFDNFILILCYLAIAAFVTAYFRTAMFVHIGHSQANKIRREYLTAVFRQEIGWFDTRRSGELTTRLTNDVPLIRDAVSERIGSLFYAVSLIIAGFIIAFTTNWKEALVVLAGTPVLIATLGFIGRFMFVYSNKAQQVYANAGSIAQEIMGSVKTVMVFGGQPVEERRYDDALDIVEATNRRKSFVESLTTSVPFFVGFSLYALALWYGSTRIINDNVSTGTIFVAFFCTTMASSGLGFLAPSIMTMNIGRGAAFEIFQIIERKSKIDTLSPAGLKPESFKGDLSFKDVKFTYPTRPDAKVLKGVSFDVPSGHTVALVGKSGSGKSTIVALLERFYDPDEGAISVDGQPITDYNVKWLRSRIGLVGQEPVLFAGTVAENIAISKPGATQEEIVEAAKRANAHDFISQLSEGYNTIVYQKGGNLSGGQKQRIAIARALIQKPHILLLDEATSALDSKSEHVVQQALEKASVGRTTIVVAHRLSTIKGANKILVFDQGNIIESGTHEELMTLKGVYANMVHLQSVAANKERHHGAEEDDENKPRAKTIDPLKGVKEETSEAVESNKKKEKKVTYWYALKRLYRNHWRFDWYFNIIGIMAGVCQGAVFPILGYVLAQVLLSMMLNTGSTLTDGVNFWCVILVVIGVGAFLSVYVQNLTFLNSGERYTRRLRFDLFSHIIRQPGAWFDFAGHEPAVFETTLAQDGPLLPKASGRLIGQFVKIVSTIAITLAIGIPFCWKLTLVIVATVPLSSLGNYLKVQSIKGFAVATRKAYEKSGVVAAEAIENIRTVYSLGLEHHFLARYNAEILKPEIKGKKDAQWNGLGFGYGEAVQLLVMSLSFWYGGKEIQNSDCGVEGMFVCIMCVVNMGLVIGDTLHIFPDFQQALDAAVSYYEILVQEKEITGEVRGLVPASCEGNVVFEDVRFSYPTRPDIEVLKGFSIEVKRGQTLALVGHSGCGKSTTVGLLERIYKHNSGKIIVDGEDITKLDISWMRRQIGYVGQEPVVFARTIRENIVHGCDGATEKDLQEAVRKANAVEFLSRLPEGLDTFVGERGSQLSGGQKQRVAIARALIRNPKILLLDEATSALDSESEKSVQIAIDEARKGRTTIVIAHRLSTIKDADVIAVVDKGRVVETGTHNELIEKQGAYYNFVLAQSMEGM